MKSSWQIKRGLGVILILISVGLITWLLWPYQKQKHEIIFDPGELILNQFGDEYSTSGEKQEKPVFMNKTAVIINWTPVIRKGSIGTIQLQVLQDFSPADSSIDTEMKISPPDSSYVEIFENYSVVATSRIVLEDLEVTPPGEIGTVLSHSQNATFSWKLIPDSTGRFQGTAWLYLDAFAIEGDRFINQPVSAQDFELKVISLLGLNFNFLWIASVAILICGVILFLDPSNILPGITLRKRLKRNSK